MSLFQFTAHRLFLFSSHQLLRTLSHLLVHICSMVVSQLLIKVYCSLRQMGSFRCVLISLFLSYWLGIYLKYKCEQSMLNLRDKSLCCPHKCEPAEQQPDFNQSDTSSYPCTAEEGNYPLEDDSTSQTGQPVPVQWFAESSIMAGNDSSSVPSDERLWCQELRKQIT